MCRSITHELQARCDCRCPPPIGASLVAGEGREVVVDEEHRLLNDSTALGLQCNGVGQQRRRQKQCAHNERMIIETVNTMTLL